MGWGKYNENWKETAMKEIKIFLKYMIACLLIALFLAGCATGQSTANDTTAVVIETQVDTQNVDVQDVVDAENTVAIDNTDSDAQSGKGLQCTIQSDESVTLADIPDYDGIPYIRLQNNIPNFTEEEKMSTEAFERYSDLDSLGRCGQAYANICLELQPTEPRGEIGNVRPSGWHTVKYNAVIDGNYLYNRCHLIAYCLAGENANEKNLITGTCYLNIEGMLPFEQKVDAYVKETGNHVLYRVTPVFDGDNLVASGVEMEGWSVEDDGAGICFHVFCYNVQPGIGIDYADGASQELVGEENVDTQAENTVQEVEPERNIDAEQADDEEQTYILNTNTKKIHLPTCSSVDQMKETNRQTYEGTLEELKNMGYSPCKRCNP